MIRRKPHGGLKDFRNYKISQYVGNHVGSKKIKFWVELINPKDGAVGLKEDMEDFINVLDKLFEGGTPDAELLELPEMLRSTLINDKGWAALVLRRLYGMRRKELHFMSTFIAGMSMMRCMCIWLVVAMLLAIFV